MHRLRYLWQRTAAFVEERPLAAFILLSLLIFLLQGYAVFLFSEPRSFHFIRQTDSLAFYLRYYQDGSSFFEPAVLNMLSDDGRVASEFPVLYYLSARIADITGHHPAILRLVNFSIIFSGLCCFFLLQLRLLKSFLLAFTGTWMAFTSTLFFFYAGNFLPDIPALGFSLCGWYVVSLYWLNGKTKHLVLYTFLFLLSGLLKVTFLVNALAVPLALILFFRSGDYFGYLNKRQLVWRSLLSCVVSILLCSAWYIYARHYNEMSHDSYFLAKARPIWSMSGEDISLTWKHMSEYWFRDYFHPTFWHIFIVLLVFNLAYLFSDTGIFSRIFFLLFGASVSLLLLFFNQFRDHDYYFIVFLPFFAFLVLGTLLLLKYRFPKVYASVFLKIAMLVLLYMGMSYADRGVSRRMNEPDLMGKTVSPLRAYAPYLEKLGIGLAERPLILGDITPDGGLYYLRRKGIPLVDSMAFGLDGVETLILKNDLTFAVSLWGQHFNEEKRQRYKMVPLLENDSIRIYRIGIN